MNRLHRVIEISIYIVLVVIGIICIIDKIQQSPYTSTDRANQEARCMSVAGWMYGDKCYIEGEEF